MTAEPTEELIERWLAAGVVSEETAADLRAYEAERAAAAAPAVGAASRVADVGAYLGAALVVTAALVIAFARFADQSGAQIAVLGIVGAAALAAAVVSRRAGVGGGVRRARGRECAVAADLLGCGAVGAGRGGRSAAGLAAGQRRRGAARRPDGVAGRFTTSGGCCGDRVGGDAARARDEWKRRARGVR